MLSRLWALVLLMPLVLIMAPGSGRAFAAPGPSIATLRAIGGSEVQGVYIRPPANVPSDASLQMLVALHGMSGNGVDFASALVTQADAHGWLIVAPTFTYGDWTNPEQILREEPALVAWLSEYINHLADHVGYTVQPRVLLFGHSRGAQLALRFTEIHPELVAGVAAVSAGTYTLPLMADAATGKALNYPFGIANLAQADGGQAFDAPDFNAVPIWIGVGARDNVDGDVPDAWDPYIGLDRLGRAQTFTQTLQSLGATVSLTVFPNAEHALTDEMRAAGCSALAATTSS